MATPIPTNDRYSRHRLIQGFSQDALQAAHIAVIGAGAIGNEVVKNLALLGVGHLTLIDFDRVELHNLTRSVLLRESDIGQFKAAVAANRARELNAELVMDVLCADVRDVFGLSQLAHCDAVIAAVDNIEARLWLNQLCLIGNKMFLHAGIDHRFVSVERFPFALPQTVTACYACNLPEGAYQRLAERYSCGGLLRAALNERVIPTTVTTASLAAAQVVWQSLRELPDARLGASAAKNAQRWFWDSYEGTAARSSLTKNSACLCCADLPALSSSCLGGQFTVNSLTLLSHLQPGQGLLLPEPILVNATCAHCQHQRTELLGQPSRRFTDKILHCPACGHASVQIDSREVLDADSIRSLNFLCASYAWVMDDCGVKTQLLDFSQPLPTEP
jgi:molybdopterin-synthase adenylyltransferase